MFLEFDGKVKYEKLLKDGQRASDVVVAEKRREELICRLHRVDAASGSSGPTSARRSAPRR